ncbi:MAG: HEAT repeat domain-containing protein [Blastocatellia bacterium]
MKKQIQLACLLIFSVLGFLFFVSPRLASSAAIETKDRFRKVLNLRERIPQRSTETFRLPATDAKKTYSLTVSLPAPAALAESESLSVSFRNGEKVVASKTLHAGDPDLYTLFQTGGAGVVEVSSTAVAPVELTVSVVEWPEGKAEKSAKATVESEPNDTWREANVFNLGQTVWATADDKPYILPLGAKAEKVRQPYRDTPAPDYASGDVMPEGGVDWFKFSYNNDQPKLVHFELDLPERDNLPVDVSIFKVVGGEAKAYEDGMDPVSPPHEIQALPGNKFTVRTITRGEYFVRVDANHVLYQLRTSMYDLPPYGIQEEGPRAAIRAGMDYVVSAGDSWHANTPRHGGVVNRVSNTHVETQLCIACHATHFPTRAELTAKQNGYAVAKRSSLEFLTERLANNPRPFYGFPEASWTRVISASANVMSRLASLVNIHETEFKLPHNIALLRGVANYLKVYYKGRTVLPNDETNGNTPIVSAYEVAWYSWHVFDQLVKLDGAAALDIEYRDRIRSLIEQDAHKNLIDLCYQTIALAEIDRTAYADKIKRNAERILSLQREDGQWSMLFEPASAAVEFQTYHCLYTLARAGYSPEHMQIAKSLKFLLSRQQAFGGWLDPRQTYENFRTPFRETQFAVMALSEFYKGNAGKGWQAGVESLPAKLSANDAGLRLHQVDNVWDTPGKTVMDDLLASLQSVEPLMRATAAMALGRVGDESAVERLARLLGDQSKIVQIVSAQAIRRIATKHVVPPLGGSVNQPPKGGTMNVIAKAILASLNSKNERTRWGATRIFAQHFSFLTSQTEIADKLIAAMRDDFVQVRMQAIKSLQQWYWWTKDAALQDRIADAFIVQMGEREHEWVRRNLQENFYSLADENVRYLYNNWIALLATPEDRQQATRGHHEASRKMAERIAKALTNGSDELRENLLVAMTDFHLRSGGYVNAGRYSRIGNDVETIKFYEEGAPAVEKALLPLLTSAKASTRKQAVIAAFAVRDNSLEELPLLVMRRLLDSDKDVRAVADEFYPSLPLQIRERNRQEAIAVLKALLASSSAEAQVAAIERIKAVGLEAARQEKFDQQIKQFVLTADGKVAAAAFRALADFPHLRNDAAIEARLAAALQSPNQQLVRSALQLVFAKSEWREPATVAAALDSLFKTEDANKRRLILGLINDTAKADSDQLLLNLVTASFADKDEQVRAAALSAARRVRSLSAHPSIRTAIAKIANDPNERLQEQAIALYGDGKPTTVTAKTLDYEFFAARIMPLLATKGRDGNACVTCHDTHAILRLSRPNVAGNYTASQLRENYASALKVVDTINPENSLLLRKPISDASQEGVVGARRTPHGGGPRWNGSDDPAYRIVLEWINGAKVQATAK